MSNLKEVLENVMRKDETRTKLLSVNGDDVYKLIKENGYTESEEVFRDDLIKIMDEYISKKVTEKELSKASGGSKKLAATTLAAVSMLQPLAPIHAMKETNNYSSYSSVEEQAFQNNTKIIDYNGGKIIVSLLGEELIISYHPIEDNASKTIDITDDILTEIFQKNNSMFPILNIKKITLGVGINNLSENSEIYEKLKKSGIESIENYNHYRDHSSDDKSKWEQTIDVMMITGKYLESNKDFINLMKVSKKYNELVLMYHYNPISDPSIFENIETQYFYKPEDVRNIKKGMNKYVHLNGNKRAIRDKGFNITNINNFDMKKQSKTIKNAEDIYEVNNNPNIKCVIITQKAEEIINNWKETHKGIGAFEGNKNLESVLFEKDVTRIGDSTFWGCTNLTSVYLPSSLQTIGNNAFRETGLTSVIIPEGVKEIGDSTFMGCTNLTSVQLPSTLKIIDVNAFFGTGLTSVTIPEGVTTIGEYAFRGCQSLTSVQLPSTLQTIDVNAFKGTDLQTVYYPQGMDEGKRQEFEKIIKMQTGKENIQFKQLS